MELEKVPGLKNGAYADAASAVNSFKSIAIDAAFCIPPGEPNYQMCDVNDTMFRFAMRLIEAGHDVEFIVPNMNDKEAAAGFLAYQYKKYSGRERSVAVMAQSEINKNDFFDALVSNRPQVFRDIMRMDTVSSFDPFLSKQVCAVTRKNQLACTAT